MSRRRKRHTHRQVTAPLASGYLEQSRLTRSGYPTLLLWNVAISLRFQLTASDPTGRGRDGVASRGFGGDRDPHLGRSAAVELVQCLRAAQRRSRQPDPTAVAPARVQRAGRRHPETTAPTAGHQPVRNSHHGQDQPWWASRAITSWPRTRWVRGPLRARHRARRESAGRAVLRKIDTHEVRESAQRGREVGSWSLEGDAYAP
jgi:hypothetical protein